MGKHAVFAMFSDVEFAKLINKLTAEQAKQLYFLKYASPLATEDRVLMDKAFKLARQRCEDGLHHTVCVARGQSGGIYQEIQINTSRGREFSSCSETGVLHSSVLHQDPLLTLVTVRFKPSKTGADSAAPVIVPPCGGCRERLRRFADPDCKVILDENGLFKFPISELLSYAYPIKN